MLVSPIRVDTKALIAELLGVLVGARKQLPKLLIYTLWLSVLGIKPKIVVLGNNGKV